MIEVRQKAVIVPNVGVIFLWNVIFVCLQIKYVWTDIQNLDGIWDGIPDFGQTIKDILDSMFV